MKRVHTAQQSWPWGGCGEAAIALWRPLARLQAGIPMGAIAAVLALPVQSSSTPTLSQPTLAQRADCRQVALAQGAPFFYTLPQQSVSPNELLPRWTRVSLANNGQTMRGGDGRNYYFVSYPYGGSNTIAGYIPVQWAGGNGGNRNTLELCRRRMW